MGQDQACTGGSSRPGSLSAESGGQSRVETAHFLGSPRPREPQGTLSHIFQPQSRKQTRANPGDFLLACLEETPDGSEGSCRGTEASGAGAGIPGHEVNHFPSLPFAPLSLLLVPLSLFPSLFSGFLGLVFFGRKSHSMGWPGWSPAASASQDSRLATI